LELRVRSAIIAVPVAVTAIVVAIAIASVRRRRYGGGWTLTLRVDREERDHRPPRQSPPDGRSDPGVDDDTPPPV
jgi:hypothetical protein